MARSRKHTSLLERANAFRSDERGASMVIVAICMTVLLGCAALVVDLGSSYVESEKLQNALDAAVMAAGDALPCTHSASGEQAVEDIVEGYLVKNGFEAGSLDIDYAFDAWGTSGYDYALRATASSTRPYLFAKAFGQGTGTVSRTAKVVAAPTTSTFKSISVYILQSSFNAQAPNLNPDKPFTITVSKSGSVTSSTNMGIMRIVTEADRTNYATYEGITAPRHAEFFRTGYYGLRVINGQPTKVGLSVGEYRPIENATAIYSSVQGALQWRIDQCKSSCNCTYDHHANNCPRIALMPVCTTSGSYAYVQSFVAIWISSVVANSTTTTITAYYLDDYRETSDIDVLDTTAALNKYTVCSKFLEE